jgi:hypothetical protein
MAARDHAEPIPRYLDDAFADLSDIKFRVSYCLPRETTDAPRDDKTVLGAIPVVPTL